MTGVFRALRRGRRALSMIEIGFGLAVAAVGLAGFAVVQNEAARAARADAAGAMLRTVTEAAVTYVVARRDELRSQVSAGGAPLAIPVARQTEAEAAPAGSLQAAGLLPAGWVDRNAYGHHHALLLRGRADGGFELLVLQQGGRSIERHLELVRVAARAGPGGGFVPVAGQAVPGAPETHVTSVGGIWSLPRTEWSAGGVAPESGRGAAYVVFISSAGA